MLSFIVPRAGVESTWLRPLDRPAYAHTDTWPSSIPVVNGTEESFSRSGFKKLFSLPCRSSVVYDFEINKPKWGVRFGCFFKAMVMSTNTIFQVCRKAYMTIEQKILSQKPILMFIKGKNTQ